MKGLRVAASFLTRFPVGTGMEAPADLAGSLPWFPVVGAVLGLVLAGVYAGTRLVMPSFVAAALAVGTGVFLTGAFHEDGLADTADALGGGWTKEEALRILKDPAHGTYGVLAIVLSVLVRVSALASLDGSMAVAILPAAHALSRAACAGLLGWVPPAVDEGLGAAYASAVTRRRALRTIGSGLLIGLALLGPWVFPAAILAGLGAGAVGWLGMRKLGGVTGDLLGAAQQAAESLVVIFGAAGAANGWPWLAWWR
jgi:adenosylcobinamide-GDP ribazoletransferase